MTSSVGGWTGSIVRLEFRSNKTVWSPAVAHENGLPWAQLYKAAASKCFDMHKDVGSFGTTGEKPETARPIEPFHRRSLPVALGGGGIITPRQLLRRNRSGSSHHDDAARRQAVCRRE